jgi:hypothetical protein
MVGLHATYDRLIENSRMDRLYVNARFANASPMGILLPFALRDQIAHVEGVSAVGAVSDLRGYYQEPQQRVSIYAVDEHMRKAWPELPLTAVQWDQLLTTPTGVFISLLRAKTTQARDVYVLSVSGHLIALGLAWAVVLAVLGGVPPAIRAARGSVRDALAI